MVDLLTHELEVWGLKSSHPWLWQGYNRKIHFRITLKIYLSNYILNGIVSRWKENKTVNINLNSSSKFRHSALRHASIFMMLKSAQVAW